MIERIWVEDKPTATNEKKSIIIIKFDDGTFVANEISHYLSKEKLADEICSFAHFIHRESHKEIT
jgi:hypothetical protein